MIKLGFCYNFSGPPFFKKNAISGDADRLTGKYIISN